MHLARSVVRLGPSLVVISSIFVGGEMRRNAINTDRWVLTDRWRTEDSGVKVGLALFFHGHETTLHTATFVLIVIVEGNIHSLDIKTSCESGWYAVAK